MFSAARIGLLILVLLLSGTALSAAELEALKAKCDGCHGPNGVSANPAVPIIAGQTPKFIAKTLRGFQMWDRPCVKCDDGAGGESDMCEVSGELGGTDIDAIAAWYGEQAFVPAKQDFDPALAAAGEAIHAEQCDSCHAEGGSLAGNGPRLAGQWMAYLQASIAYVPTGERMCPGMMERKVAALGKDEITQLLNYYASQQD
jgi:sulfide dehydrogenase cytochrome subunit